MISARAWSIRKDLAAKLDIAGQVEKMNSSPDGEWMSADYLGAFLLTGRSTFLPDHPEVRGRETHVALPKQAVSSRARVEPSKLKQPRLRG